MQFLINFDFNKGYWLFHYYFLIFKYKYYKRGMIWNPEWSLIAKYHMSTKLIKILNSSCKLEQRNTNKVFYKKEFHRTVQMFTIKIFYLMGKKCHQCHDMPIKECLIHLFFMIKYFSSSWIVYWMRYFGYFEISVVDIIILLSIHLNWM